MKKGTVKFFNTERGFGFITPEDNSQEIFVHYTGLVDEIRENDKVQYETTQGNRGLSAVNVEVLD
ncbi:cold-shock protein [Sinomicrobium soli]|uniref:cold-shock protein n=1 Tax=Sinomicrobium sp. N-1-3-6 TaxID=2219864 RepID=UPI000DCCEAAF|nr:cold-shock protein [Sinomicrobium sp. N-1-3-6]RAV29091.1 cold-shock protein [Sinomicrobium sp. N-1-3-6]